MLKPDRDTHITFDTRAMLHTYLTALPYNTVDFQTYEKGWLGTPTQAELHGLQNHAPQDGGPLTLKEAM